MWTWLLALAVGLSVSVQPIVNAALSRRIGAASAALLASVVATVVLLGAVVVSGNLSTLREWRDVPLRYLWGGVGGAVIVLGMVVVVRRLGAGPALATAIAAQMLAAILADQMLAAILADHYGLFGLTQVPISLAKVGGVLLLVGGAWLINL